MIQLLQLEDREFCTLIATVKVSKSDSIKEQMSTLDLISFYYNGRSSADQQCHISFSSA